MARKKYSGGFEEYESKLKRVMERLGVKQYKYDWSRNECFIEFTYKNQYYRFEHSLHKAAEHKQNIHYSSDLFAQLVKTLEDIARMVERGIYDLSTWIEGMKTLPPKKQIPQCFVTLGFDNIPTMDELKNRFRILAKESHPDSGGNPELFCLYKSAYEEAEMCLREEQKNEK